MSQAVLCKDIMNNGRESCIAIDAAGGIRTVRTSISGLSCFLAVCSPEDWIIGKDELHDSV